MDFTRTTYVEFFSPGSFVDERSRKEVSSRDPKSVKVPKAAFGFQFLDVITAEVESEGETVKLSSGDLKHSPIHYYGGTVMDEEAVKRDVPDNETLLSNMQCNEYPKVIRTRRGNFKPFRDEDIYIEAA